MPDDEFRCSRCGRQFEEKDHVACISAKIMGDECTDSFYWCESCEVYTIRLLREVFAGPESARSSEPISKQEGDRRLAMIRSCREPWDDRCQCDGHRAYFGDWLDGQG
jgi:hypothetical protein